MSCQNGSSRIGALRRIRGNRNETTKPIAEDANFMSRRVSKRSFVPRENNARFFWPAGRLPRNRPCCAFWIANATERMNGHQISLAFSVVFLFQPTVLRGQTSSITNSSAPLDWTAQQDHKNMMKQLGITRLRPGPSGQPGLTNSANYDAAKANPFPDLPELLMLKSGAKVTTPEMWWKQRRPEIVEDFEREVIGRLPKGTPEVTWTVVSDITDGFVGKLPANGKRLVGHVDNSAYPEITVDIRMTVVIPVWVKTPVPVLMMFGGFGGDGMPRAAGSPAPTNRFAEFGGPFKDPPSTEQLLTAGWGYATINPGSIQA